MGRAIAGVVLGYLTMFVIVFITLTASFLTLGVDRVFVAGAYDVSMLWIVVMTVFSLVAAIVGGKACAAIGKKKGAITALIIVVAALGLLNAIPAMMSSAPPELRSGDVSNVQAMTKGKEPVWFALLLPVIGVVGVWIGGQSLKRSSL